MAARRSKKIVEFIDVLLIASHGRMINSMLAGFGLPLGELKDARVLDWDNEEKMAMYTIAIYDRMLYLDACL